MLKKPEGFNPQPCISEKVAKLLNSFDCRNCKGFRRLSWKEIESILMLFDCYFVRDYNEMDKESIMAVFPDWSSLLVYKPFSKVRRKYVPFVRETDLLKVQTH